VRFRKLRIASHAFGITNYAAQSEDFESRACSEKYGEKRHGRKHNTQAEIGSCFWFSVQASDHGRDASENKTAKQAFEVAHCHTWAAMWRRNQHTAAV
jgi:hypothetical protein